MFLIGRSFKSSALKGLLFSVTAYSVAPILAEPAGRMRFCAPMTADTSEGETPHA